VPVHLKALVVILVLAGVVFAIARPAACALACAPEDYARRRNLWFAITLAAFLAHNFWIFIAFAAALLLFAAPKEHNKVALAFLLLFAAPAIPAPIPGLGLVNYLFNIDYLRLLILTLFLPAFFSLRGKPGVEPFGRLLADKLLAAYLILLAVLVFKDNRITDALRGGLFYPFIDIFLPYYVASRSLRTLAGFRDALMAFVLAALVLAAIGAFEYAKRWLLYAPLSDALGVYWSETTLYLARGESLRALGSTGQPIPLGYAMAVALGFALYLRQVIPDRMAWGCGVLLLGLGLLAPLSRGPWVGAAALVLVFVATGPRPALRTGKIALLVALLVPALVTSSVGQAIIDHLPIVGTVDEGNVVYRQLLLEISMQVLMQNPFFGAWDYLRSPLMEQLRTGQGIIDVVNTYLGIALSTGLVGLSLFAGFFIAAVLGAAKAMLDIADKHDERYVLGQALLATLIGILVIIFTVSSITIIPAIYWMVAGLAVAYARMVAAAKAPRCAFRGQEAPAW
jgi:O-antigen ligase